MRAPAFDAGFSPLSLRAVRHFFAKAKPLHQKRTRQNTADKAGGDKAARAGGKGVPKAKAQALEENLRRAEREGGLNLGFGAEWEAWKPEERK